MDVVIAFIPLEEGIWKGFIFGLVHVGLLTIGYYSGWSINRLLKKTSNGHIAGIIGAVLAHIIADLTAALLDPTMRSAAYGIFLGGLVPLMFIPLLEKYVTKQPKITASDEANLEKS